MEIDEFCPNMNAPFIVVKDIRRTCNRSSEVSIIIKRHLYNAGMIKFFIKTSPKNILYKNYDKKFLKYITFEICIYMNLKILGDSKSKSLIFDEIKMLV